jgi:hypothetical protein
MKHAQYDPQRINALADELMNPQRLADGGPPNVPPTSKFRKAAAAVQAARSIGDDPLPGAPATANIPNIGTVSLRRNLEAEAAAIRASELSGVPYRSVDRYMPIDVPRSERLAREYDRIQHDPYEPDTKKAYDEMIRQTKDQYDAMIEAGITPYYVNAANNPYPNSPYEVLFDIMDNKRVGVFPTVEGFGSDPSFNAQGNPLLLPSGRMIDGKPALNNDLFRAVHDYFGHSKSGVGFRGAGEEAAYQSHAGMFSPLARRALASETRGQNSWLNYGPYGETNRTAKVEDTRFADQKVGLMPRWASEERLIINDDRRREFFDNLARNRTGLEGAISDDGKLRLIHYSSQPLERIDPKFYGRGLSRASLAERNRSYDPEFVKRSYYGIPASEKPYVPEFGLGSIRNEVLIEPELIYQAQANPEGLWLPNDPTGSERRIAESGYTGYYTNHPKLGKVAVIFDPYDVSKTYMIPVGAVGAGAMAMSGEDELETMANGGPPRSRIAKAAAAVRQATDSDLDMSTEGVATADIKKSFIVNPKLLIFRETEQSQANKDSLTGDSDDFDPIVVIGNDLKNLSILDGHHRASVARDRGDSLQAVRVTESEYDLLKKKGFDDTEIAYAALQRANKGYAAGNLDSQFKGSRVADNGDRAWDELLSEDDPEGMSKGGLVDKLRSAASSVKEAGNVYKAAVGNMFSPWEPREERPPGLYPSDWEYPELQLRRPGIVNLAIGMPNMFADLRDLYGAVKDVAIGDEVPDEEWARWDKATEAQGRYEEDMDKFLRSYTGKSVDELSAPMSAVLGVSEAAAQLGFAPAKVVAGLPRLARYLSNLAEFATPVTVASPGAMLTSATVNAGIRALPALTDGDELEEMERRYSQPPAARYRGEVARRREDRENKLKMIADRRAEKLNRSPATMAEGGLVYDANRINALAAQLMEPVRLADGGPPPRSRIARAAAAVRGAGREPDLDMSTEARMKRADEQGLNLNVYHGTHAEDLTEVDPSMVDLGLHVGTYEQAENRLRDLSNPLGGGNRHANRYRTSANIIPLRVQASNPLLMEDAGDWMDSEQVLAKLKNLPEFMSRAEQLDEMQGYVDEIKPTYYGGEMDWRDSSENREILDEIKTMLDSSGYDSIRYLNQVENLHGSEAAFTKEADQMMRQLRYEGQDIEMAIRDRMPQVPELSDPDAAAKIEAYRNAKLEDYATQEELQRINEMREMLSLIREDPKSRLDPNSYIILNPSNIRSVNAAFDPAKRGSADLLAGTAGAALLGGAAMQDEPEQMADGGLPRSRISRAAAAVRSLTEDADIARDGELSRQVLNDYINGIIDTLPEPSMPPRIYTAADRAEAGRQAAALIRSQDQIKASEALGRLMEQGFRRTATTQADRTIVGDGNIGGPNFPVLGMVDPEYAGRSWGVMAQSPATTLIRQSSPETAWTTMLGSADQLKSNQLVFDDLQDAFVSSMRQGNLTPELESKYNQNLRLLFGEDADIRDPEIWSRANTFAKRSAFADILLGKGLGGEKSGRGVIFNPSEILKRQTEPSLLHPSQGGTVPTYSLGPRMFTIEDSVDYRPDLHPGFPMLLKGRDLGLNVIPTPTEIYLPDWHRNFREVMAQKTPPRKAPAGRYDLASGLKGQGLPSQDLTDDYIRHLIREGFAKGGLANYKDMMRGV